MQLTTKPEEFPVACFRTTKVPTSELVGYFKIPHTSAVLRSFFCFYFGKDITLYLTDRNLVHNLVHASPHHSIYRQGIAAIRKYEPASPKLIFSNILPDVQNVRSRENAFYGNFAFQRVAQTVIQLFTWKKNWGSAPHTRNTSPYFLLTEGKVIFNKCDFNISLPSVYHQRSNRYTALQDPDDRPLRTYNLSHRYDRMSPGRSRSIPAIWEEEIWISWHFLGYFRAFSW